MKRKISVLIARNDKPLLSSETKETIAQSIALGRSRVWRNTSLVLVRGVTSSTAPVTATVAAPRRESPAPLETSSSTARTSSSTAAAHARNVGALGRNLDVASLEDTLVQDEGLGN